MTVIIFFQEPFIDKNGSDSNVRRFNNVAMLEDNNEYLAFSVFTNTGYDKIKYNKEVISHYQVI